MYAILVDNIGDVEIDKPPYTLWLGSIDREIEVEWKKIREKKRNIFVAKKNSEVTTYTFERRSDR